MRFLTPNAIGLPYHGIAINNILDLGNGETLTVPTAAGPDTLLMQHPAAPGVVRSTAEQAADTARGYNWKDYLILRGTTRIVGNQPLGTNAWIYVDPAGTPWIVSVSYGTRSGASYPVTVTLEAMFGRFDANGQQAINSTIGSGTVSSSYASATLAGDLDYLFDWGTDAAVRVLQALPSADGTKAAINVGIQAGVGDSPALIYGAGNYTITDVYSITISGSGSLELATLGDGISASISHVYDIDDLIIADDSDSTTGNLTVPYEDNTTEKCLDGSILRTSTVVRDWTVRRFCWYSQNGTLQYAESNWSSTYSRVISGTLSGCVDCSTTPPAYDTRSASVTATVTYTSVRTLTVGNHTATPGGWSGGSSGDVSTTEFGNVFDVCTGAQTEQGGVDLDLLDAVELEWSTDRAAEEIYVDLEKIACVGVIFYTRGLLTSPQRIIVGWNGESEAADADPPTALVVSYEPGSGEFEQRTDGSSPSWV